MYQIIENAKIIAPFLIAAWGILIVRTLRKPQSYFNSILLVISCFFTLLFLSGLFGKYIGYALLAMFLIIMLALFLVPIMLIVNGIHMIKKESLSFSHLLSLLLGIGVGAGEIATVILVLSSCDLDFLKHWNLFALFLSITVFYWSSLILSFVLYCIYIDLLPHRNNFNYIIIHGCGLINGSKVSKLLAARIDKAISIYQKCKVKPYIIASGGKGNDEQLSEAQAMSDYLIAHGIEQDRIILEDQSKTTMENLTFSKKIIDSREGGKKVALVSSNYHIYRCLKYAKAVELKCIGIGSKVAPYFWPTAVIREFIAILKGKAFFIISVLGYLFLLLPLLQAL